jgi:fatty acid desaturase
VDRDSGYISSWRRWELPTWGLALAIYGGWFALTFWASTLPWYLVGVLGGWLVAWHGSLQHEVIHGHPTRSTRVNLALGGLPLGLWLPLGVYRDEHIAHHRSDELTDPAADPESNYVTADDWRRRGPLGRALWWLRATLLGRMILGPPWMIASLWRAELGRLLRGDTSHVRHWLVHLAGVAAVLGWLVAICGMPLWAYVVFFVYPGTALTLVRSYAEHRPAAHQRERTAVVERAPVFGLLFLFNNLHVVHHEDPRLPWYEIPPRYRRGRARYLADNGNARYRGYASLFLRHAVRPIDAPIHPRHRQGGTLA